MDFQTAFFSARTTMRPCSGSRRVSGGNGNMPEVSVEFRCCGRIVFIFKFMYMKNKDIIISSNYIYMR